ncbi:MAG: apolipoprotein N-acyltransferase [Alphaproteobacteria bacterium]|nr:MAG: apolipoprotein N-acyltransferase [Alphaproteobacteria bacterium]
MRYATFKNKCEHITGVKKYALAFGLGALLTFTMPPIGFVPALFVCVPGLIFLSINAPSRGKSFLTGWAFGAGYFIFGLYWVSAALFVDLSQWGWALPFSAILGPAVLALFYGFIPLLARRWRHEEPAYALAVCALWAAIEYLRGHILTGFPWNLPGYAWHWVLPVLQTAAVTGIYGLTLLTLVWAALPALTKQRRAVEIVAGILVLAAMGGAFRLLSNPTEQSGHYTVRIVQANIPENIKWDNDEDWRNLEKHMKLTKEKSDLPDPITFVVWPETAVSADLAAFPDIAHIIAASLPKDSLGLLGALRVDASNQGHPRFYNSVSVLDKHDKVIGTYDKHHLVPFGEYIPLRDKIPFTPLALAVSGIGEFTRGPGPSTVHIGDLPPFSPLICYEVIFPGEVVDQKDRPDWMVNVTNDGWYGQTAGPHQHLGIARLRAIEEGLPLARAANTGISAMFDPLGRFLGDQPLGDSGYVDSILPKPMPPTVYSQLGDSLFFALLAATLAAAEWLRSKRKA